MDRTADIALFLRVLDLGSISAAARALDLSVAVASQRLKRLESELGVRLLHRTTRRLHPTTEGRLLAEQGRMLVQDLEALTESLRQAGAGVAGVLRMTLPATFARLHISPLLPGFLQRHPALRLDVDLSDHQLDLVGAGLDLAIRIGRLDDSSLVARRLARNRRVLCASPAYLQRHGAPRTPAQLQQHQCLLLLGAQGRVPSWRLVDSAGDECEVRVDGRIRSNQGELLHGAAVAGQGIGLFSLWHVCDDLRAGRLQRVLPDHAPPETGIHALMPQRRLVPPRVRAFVEYLAEHIGDPPPWEDTGEHATNTRTSAGRGSGR